MINGISFAITFFWKPFFIPRIHINKTHIRFSFLFFGIWILFLDLEKFFFDMSYILKKYDEFVTKTEIKSHD